MIKKILVSKMEGKSQMWKKIHEPLKGKPNTRTWWLSCSTRLDWFLHSSDERRRLQTEVPSAGADDLLSSGFIAGNSSTSWKRTITNTRRFIYFPRPGFNIFNHVKVVCQCNVITSRVTSNFPHAVQVKQINRVVVCYEGCKRSSCDCSLSLDTEPPNRLLLGLAGATPQPAAVV